MLVIQLLRGIRRLPVLMLIGLGVMAIGGAMDLVVVGVGAAPRLKLAQRAGLEIREGGIATDEYLRSSVVRAADRSGAIGRRRHAPRRSGLGSCGDV